MVYSFIQKTLQLIPQFMELSPTRQED